MAKRIFITGGPSTGKSSLAQKLAFQHGIKNVLNTDALIALGWSEASAEAVRWMDAHQDHDYIVEGCATARTLRKWMEQNQGKPLPEGSSVYILNLPYVPQSKPQQTMAKGMYTVLTEIYGEIVSRGGTFEQPQADQGENNASN